MSKVEIRNIGKNEALSILKKNKRNRILTRANIDFVKNEMLSGTFSFNGATIVISKNGNLLDGQHRLIALSETDLRFDFIFVLDVDESVFKTIDTGKNRCAGDVLSIENVKNSNNVASAIRKIMEEFGTKRKRGKIGAVKISNSEIFEYYMKNKKEISYCMDLCVKLYNREIKVITPSNATAFLILFSRVDKKKAKSFIRELFTGEKEDNSNASQILRKRLLNYKISGVRLSASLLRALFIIAFKAYCENRDITTIQVKKDYKEYIFYENSND